MLPKLLSRIKSIFVPMPSPGPPAYVPPEAPLLPCVGQPQDIKGYIIHIVCQIQSGNGPELQSLSQHQVVKLEYCKNMTDGDKHEFLVATVVDDTGIPFRLQIERVIFACYMGLTPVKPEKTSHGFLALLTLEAYHSVAPPSEAVLCPLTFLAASSQAFTSAASRSDTSLDSTASSLSEAPQALIESPGPAFDRLSRLRPSDAYPPGVAVLRSFEPLHDSLSLLHLAMIIEAVHDVQPDYHVLSANCSWFATMIMGISMLQGGYVRVVGETSPAEDEPLEPPQVFIEPHTLSDPAMPEDLMPIPTPNKDDIEVITNGAGAGKKTLTKVSFKEIWEVGQRSQNHYDAIRGYLKDRRTYKELITEAEARGEARGKARAEARMQIQLELDANQRENQDLQRQLRTLTRGSTQSDHAGASIPRSL
ncbi:hypothetical protein BJ912DRAFT_994557, partial [Pholiota molesta]